MKGDSCVFIVGSNSYHKRLAMPIPYVSFPRGQCFATLSDEATDYEHSAKNPTDPPSSAMITVR